MQVKSRQRVADHGEVFTAEREVKAMLDLVKAQSEQIASTFWSLRVARAIFGRDFKPKTDNRPKIIPNQQKPKIPKCSQFHYEKHAIHAMSSIYGIELLSDNCTECRSRLLGLFLDHYQSHFKQTNSAVIQTAEFLLSKTSSMAMP